MDEQKRTRPNLTAIWSTILVALAAIVASVIAGRWYQRRREKQAAARTRRSYAPPIHLPDVKGLTEEEAKARRIEGQDNVIHFTPPRTRNQIIRDNVYTIFNLTLVGLAIAQLLLRLPLDALISLGVIVLNIALNVFQEMFARRRLQAVELSTRPRATVVRDQRVRSIDPSEIVLGDILIAGPGDQLLADGQVAGDGRIVVDESMLTGDTVQHTRHAGDPVYAGSFCVSGRAAYEVQKVGSDRLIASLTDKSEAGSEELTSLERIIGRVLKVLMIIVFILTAILLIRYFRIDTGVIDVDAIAGAASVIFSIAPSGLFFMIFLTYAAGTADLARVGALVHRSRSVESLAQVTTICFARAGILTGSHVKVENLEAAEDQERLSESRIQQILGDFAWTTSVDNLTTRAMKNAFEGNRRIVVEEAPFFSVYGWSGIAFDDDDLRGIYILGEPEILEEHLPAADDAEAEEEESTSTLAAVQSRLSGLGHLFRRSTGTTDGEESQTEAPGPVSAQPSPEPHEEEDKGSNAQPEQDTGRWAFIKRLRGQVGRIVRREKPETEEEASSDRPVEESVFLFAYIPDLAPLHTPGGEPQLPKGLIPLCNLRYTEQVRPEAVDTIKGFAESGVGIKVFAGDNPERAAAILQQAGLGASPQDTPQQTVGGQKSTGQAGTGTSVGAPLGTISGAELADMDAEKFGEAAERNTIFGQIDPKQASQVVKALREQGELVAVVGDGVNDLPPMRQANLSVARQNSSQSALSVAGIILLESSSSVLLGVLDKGQRIVNGLLDVLKLYLTQVFYLALLIIAIPLVSSGFPYQSSQGTAISVITLSIPSLALSLLATAGIVQGSHLSRQLSRFVAPASITIGAAALAVYLYFFSGTGDMAYTQLAVTYTLVTIGLLLMVFVQPPRHLKPGRDWVFAIGAVVLVAIFLVLPAIGLAQEYLGLDWLRQPADYLVVGGVVLCWGVVLQLSWLILRLVRQPKAARSG